MNLILVVNAGSSSFKYQVVSPLDGTRVARGLVERIGSAGGRIRHERIADPDDVSDSGEVIEREMRIRDHTAGFKEMFDAFEESGKPLTELGVLAVGHRVVQGGSEFVEPTIIDDHVQQRILDLSVLAPLHNPGEHQAIVAARAVFPHKLHVAVFDTAFHQSMPPEAYTYAIDVGVAEQYGIRRYGFHGTSHQVVSRLGAEFLDRTEGDLKQIVLHLGNGASACAVDKGRSVETSMGLTPLGGLVMGTRAGDLDPAVLLHLAREAKYNTKQLDELLNSRSGLLGMSGHSDMRDVREAADGGDPAAQLAIAVTVHRIKHYIGAYLAILEGADVITFTGGVGENQAVLREEVITGLEWLGVQLDPIRNSSAETGARRISTDGSRVTVLVVPTDEEREIATQTLGVRASV